MFFYRIWDLWPYGPCDLDGLNILSFLSLMEAVYESLLQLAFVFFRNCLKLSYYERTVSKVKE